MGGQMSGEAGRELPYDKTDATLYYFKGRGLADQVRWMLAFSGVTFAGRVVDTRAKFLKMAASQLPFGQLPLLQIDGVELVQSQAIIRYLAKRASLQGKDAREEVICDMIAETVRDLIGLIAGASFARRKGPADLEKHLAMCKEKWAARATRLEQGLRANGGNYLVGKGFTYADVLVAHCLTWFVEECGPAIVEKMPRLVSLQNRVLEAPNLRTFIQGRQWYPLGDKEYCDNVDAVLGRTQE